MNKQHTILCVDDEEIILRTLKRSLGLEGYKVLTAPNGQEALKVLEAEPVDLVISDQRMPVMDGSQLLRLVRKNYPHIVSIMLSAYSDFEALVQALNEGEVFRFLAKPWDNTELKRVIQFALEHKRVLNIIEGLVKEASTMFKLAEKVSVDVSPDKSCISLKMGEEGLSFSDEVVFKFLEFIFGSLGVKKEGDIKAVSSLITKQKGVVTAVIDMGKGVSLKIELPRPEASDSPQ